MRRIDSDLLTERQPDLSPDRDICLDSLMALFRLPRSFNSVWLVAYDRPTSKSHAVLVTSASAVHVDTVGRKTTYSFYDGFAEAYLEPFVGEVIHVECEYR
jgi:hypothetical protein